ncbi:helix-turn-helix domain-containing protein [Kitasatospora sp. NPDC057692]|uniref:helix-turn-helix domain-containing protein n=1 Tax=Kitasatospora sp. NPDC057692 TaxID=3346215 RepID=UPI0036CB0AAE
MTERDLSREPDRLPERAAATRPDPGGATTPQEFVRRLRAVKAWSGNPSLRELERRTGLPRSTLSGDMSPRRTRLPPLDRVLALATACGVPAEELARWRCAWQRIQVREQSAEPPAPRPPAAAEPPASEPAPRPPRPPQPPASEPAPRPPQPLRPPRPPQPPREPDRTGRRRSARRRPVRPVLSAGGLLAALLAVLLSAAPVTGESGAAAGDRPTRPVGAEPPGPCGFLGRISDNLAAAPLDAAATTGESLPVRSPVARGDTLIVTLVLAGAGPGPITVRDTAGNRYRPVRDETTDGTRLAVFALIDARPLDALDQITFLWPSAKHDYTAVDEFRSTRPAEPASAPDAPGEPLLGSGSAQQC